jgi:hypothetical protein
MATFFEKLHDRLISELEYDRADMDRELNVWIEKNGDGKESLCRFYRSALESGELHFSGERFAKLEQNPQLRSVYLVMFELYLKADWDWTPTTKKLNELNMREASNSRLKMKMEIIPPGRCNYGDEFDGRQYDLETSLKEFPLDYGKCERKGGCACTVGFEAIRDENGRLIHK